MKYDRDSILSRLIAGDSQQSIADEMAKALNDAMAEKAKLDAKAKADEQAKAKKTDAASRVVDAIADYMDLTTPDLAKELRDNRTEYIKVFDEAMAEMAGAMKMLIKFNSSNFDRDWDSLFSRFLH